jgi:hypothetical protein
MSTPGTSPKLAASTDAGSTLSTMSPTDKPSGPPAGGTFVTEVVVDDRHHPSPHKPITALASSVEEDEDELERGFSFLSALGLAFAVSSPDTPLSLASVSGRSDLDPLS